MAGFVTALHSFLFKPIDSAKLASALNEIRPRGCSIDGIETLPGHAGSMVAILDTDRLELIAKTLGPEQRDKLLVMFRDDIGTRPKAIGDLLASDEISAAQRSAHSLSGAALHLGAMKLAETARQFELIDTDADRLIHELLRIAGETVAAIDHYRITMAAQPTSKAQ